MDLEENNNFVETAVPQGEFVLMIARGVGFLVAIVAVTLAILLMMSIRAFLALALNKLGVCVLSIIFGMIIWLVTKLGGVSGKSIWIIFYRGCC